ncbi:MAG TPA: hypothetical protein VK568_11420, partial [Thermodesulfobacteriota bacterium]|nr:hypothetical protein [Thermodesulfobacteriota bacterium]
MKTIARCIEDLRELLEKNSERAKRLNRVRLFCVNCGYQEIPNRVLTVRELEDVVRGEKLCDKCRSRLEIYTATADGWALEWNDDRFLEIGDSLMMSVANESDYVNKRLLKETDDSKIKALLKIKRRLMKLSEPQYKISRKNSIKGFLWGIFFLGFAALIVCSLLNEMGWSIGGLIGFGVLFLFSYLGYDGLKGAMEEWKEYKKERQDYEIHLGNKEINENDEWT